MTFQQKNNTVSLVSFVAITAFFLVRVGQLIADDNFSHQSVVRLWIVVALLAVIATIVAMIFTHSVATAIESVQSGDPDFEIDKTVDERDRRIDLEGTSVTYTVSSLGAFVAMVTYALGNSPLVMFTLLIFFGMMAQIAGDLKRLWSYREV